MIASRAYSEHLPSGEPKRDKLELRRKKTPQPTPHPPQIKPTKQKKNETPPTIKPTPPPPPKKKTNPLPKPKGRKGSLVRSCLIAPETEGHKPPLRRSKLLQPSFARGTFSPFFKKPFLSITIKAGPGKLFVPERSFSERLFNIYMKPMLRLRTRQNTELRDSDCKRSC